MMEVFSRCAGAAIGRRTAGMAGVGFAFESMMIRTWSFAAIRFAFVCFEALQAGTKAANAIRHYRLPVSFGTLNSEGLTAAALPAWCRNPTGATTM